MGCKLSVFPIFSYFGHSQHNWYKYFWTILNVQSFLLNQGYNHEITHSDHTEDWTATTFRKEYEYCEQQCNIRDEWYKTKTCTKYFTKNGKRDWMYDAMEKRQLVIKPQWIKVRYNLKLKAKVILALGNEINRSHKPHTQIYLMGESDLWEKSLGE